MRTHDHSSSSSTNSRSFRAKSIYFFAQISRCTGAKFLLRERSILGVARVLLRDSSTTKASGSRFSFRQQQAALHSAQVATSHEDNVLLSLLEAVEGGSLSTSSSSDSPHSRTGACIVNATSDIQTQTKQVASRFTNETFCQLGNSLFFSLALFFVLSFNVSQPSYTRDTSQPPGLPLTTPVRQRHEI